MVYIFNKNIISILWNFIPHETVLFDNRDSPWMNKEIKQLIHEKRNIFNCWRRINNHKQLLDRLKDLQIQLNFLIDKSERKYYLRITSKLSDIGKVLRLLGPFQKVPWMSKKFHVSHHYLKQRIYYRFQSKKNRTFQLILCKLVFLNNGNSELPSNLSCKTNQKLSSVEITNDDIIKLIAKLIPNKAHGHDRSVFPW